MGIGVLSSIWVTFFYVIIITSRSSSLYLRKKLNEDAGTPAYYSSIWVARMSLPVSLYFLLAFTLLGSFLFVVFCFCGYGRSLDVFVDNRRGLFYILLAHDPMLRLEAQ